MNNLVLRTITGSILVTLIVSSIIICKFFFALILLSIIILSLIEFYRLIANETIKPHIIYGIIASIFIFVLNTLIAFDYIPFKNMIWLILPFLFPFIIELFTKQDAPILNISITLLGFIYIVFPLTLLIYFYQANIAIPYKYLLGFFIFIWINDTMAYLTGKQFGKHALFLRISPKKTWEGTIGGIVFTILTAWGIAIFLHENFYLWFIFALITVIPGIFGDLIESLFKRSIQAKDSGSILPGHGGMLDRFDAVLFAAPFAFIFLKLILNY